MRTGGGNNNDAEVAGAMKGMSSSCWSVERGAATERNARRESGFHLQFNGSAFAMAKTGSASRAALGGKCPKGEDLRRKGKSNNRYW